MTSPLKRRNQGLDTEDRLVPGKRQKTEASQEEDESDSYSHSTGKESEDGRGSDREPDEHDGTGSENEEISGEEDSESPAALSGQSCVIFDVAPTSCRHLFLRPARSTPHCIRAYQESGPPIRNLSL
ncbi:hypothetical protein C8R44DRAFT_806396 [Mycena epipterygia]|nr:hypothetical protein C8R44DRAFT_806396 [Mycena epipterygia]